MTSKMSKASLLKARLAQDHILTMPGCHDAMSAKLIEQAGFEVGFMSGFAVAGSRLAMPDTGLISYGEMLDQGRTICSTVSIPMIGDGDTGFGNALNIKRTVKGYADAGFACIMLEDQVAPKRCGHTKGKSVVDRMTAEMRIQAAVDAKEEGADILIMARTDSRASLGLDEAIERCKTFRDLGADVTFLEAPESKAEMQRYCSEVSGAKMANLIENGKTPILSYEELEAMGYSIAVYPLSLLSASIKAMQVTLGSIKRGDEPSNVLHFDELQAAVGFPDYYDGEVRYHGG